jgi:propanol-preferring alcohol dehydrogenase
MVEKMRAMVLSKLGPIETKPLKITEIDKHQIKRSNEILIKIEACGVCHSQLHGIEGDWKDLGIPPTLPTVPGHEIAGKVVEVGNDVTKFKVGDRAGISPLLESCMKCQYWSPNKTPLLPGLPSSLPRSHRYTRLHHLLEILPACRSIRCFLLLQLLRQSLW